MIRLPATSSPPRTSTGTIALSAPGSSPRRSRKSRSAPAQTASTASLMWCPTAGARSRRSSTGRVAVTEHAVGRRGTRQRRSPAPAGSRRARSRAAHPQRRARVQREPERGAPASAVPSRTRSAAARARRALARVCGSGAGGGGFRRRRPRPRASGRAARPRARARPRRRPCSGAPCRRCPRARRRAPGRSTCPTAGVRAASGTESAASATGSSVPARPSWMCSRGSKPGSSSQTGSCRPSGTGASRWCQRGARSSRVAMCVASASKSGARPRRGRVEVRDPADVHVRRGRLDGEERRVERAEPVRRHPGTYARAAARLPALAGEGADQPVGLVLLRMPQRAEHEAPRGVLDRLDRAVAEARAGDPQALTDPRPRPGGGSSSPPPSSAPAARAARLPGSTPDAVVGEVAARATVDVVLEAVGEILVERAAVGHVDDLHAAAEAEAWQVALGRGSDSSSSNASRSAEVGASRRGAPRRRRRGRGPTRPLIRTPSRRPSSSEGSSRSAASAPAGGDARRPARSPSRR